MRFVILASILFLVGCHTVETVNDPVLRLEARDDLYTAGQLLSELGRVAGAAVEPGDYGIENVRIFVPNTIRLSLSEFQALMFQYHIGMDVDRDGDKVTRIALRNPVAGESPRLRMHAFVQNDSAAVSLHPLVNHKHIEMAFPAARQIQRKQSGSFGDGSGWSIPPLVIMQDSIENLRETMDSVARRYQSPEPPPAEGAMQRVYPFSLESMDVFYGED